jgi:hypothetical protein
MRVEQAVTITSVSLYVGTGGGAGTNNTIRVTDGVNNCDAVFSCASLTATGVQDAIPTGTCNFAENAPLRVCELTAGCTPDPNLRNVAVKGFYR